MGKGFLSGGYKGANSKAIYPSGKSMGKLSAGGLSKKVSGKQAPAKITGKTAGKSGPKFMPAKSQQSLDKGMSAPSLLTMNVTYKK